MIFRMNLISTRDIDQVNWYADARIYPDSACYAKISQPSKESKFIVFFEIALLLCYGIPIK